MSTGDANKSDPILEGGDTALPNSWQRTAERPVLNPANYFIPTSSPPPSSSAQPSLFASAPLSNQQLTTQQLNNKPAVTAVPDHTRALVHSQNRPAAVAPSQTTVFKQTPNIYSYHRHQGQMDLHDTAGTLLGSFGTQEDTVPAVGQAVGQTVSVSHGVPQTSAAMGASLAQTLTAGQGLSAGQTLAQHVTQTAGHPLTHSTGTHPSVRVETSTGAPAASGTTAPTPAPLPDAQKELRKPARMPGTKQCPSCQGTIAAAVAKCPKCGHVFRPKKDKPKRSGKRGKKNCPKCSFENPSACSSCKNCKHVFRLKLMDRYKQMRPRATADNPATAAAVAHAAALHVQSQAPQPPTTISSTSLPMPSGVQQYQISQTALQPQQYAIPPLAQHSMGMHHVGQNHVAPNNVQTMHTLPQHPSQQHHQL